MVVGVAIAALAGVGIATRSTTVLAADVRAAASGMPWWNASEVATISAMRLDVLGPPPPDPSNRVADDPRAAALGARLFDDRRLSATGTVSCASCHQAARGFQDGRARAVGAGTTTRRTMSVVGTAYAPWLFWDGRADSQWAQALGPLESAAEHGGTRARYVRVLAAYYRPQYAALFGALPSVAGLPRAAGPRGNAAERAAWAALSVARRDSISRAFANMGKALAAYERTLAYPSTRFDRYAGALAAERRPAAGEILSADEAAGLRLFVGKARCATCHTGARFTDDQFHNTGVPAVDGLPPDDGRIAGVDGARTDPFNCTGAFSDADTARDTQACAELRFAAHGQSALLRAYRPPSLRGVAARAPYMHAGQFSTLRAVLAHYNAAPSAPRGVSELHPLGLSDRELRQLEQFLGTLSPEPAAGRPPHPGAAARTVATRGPEVGR